MVRGAGSIFYMEADARCFGFVAVEPIGVPAGGSWILRLIVRAQGLQCDA